MTSLMKRRDKGKWMNREELSGRRKKEEVAGGEIKRDQDGEVYVKLDNR